MKDVLFPNLVRLVIMETKLTLRLKKETVERAKLYAKQNNTSLSKLVERFFERIKGVPGKEGMTEEVLSLRGILKKSPYSDEEVKRSYYEDRLKKHIK